MFPPVPDWDGLHPLAIHFPIALFFTVPIFIAISIFWKKDLKPFALAALMLMVMATAASFVAVSTGKAAGELADRTPQISAALERHEEKGELVRLIFSVLTAAYAALILIPWLLKKELNYAWSLSLKSVFLILSLGGCLQVAQTAHLGGILVHRFGVHAIIPQTPGEATSQQSNSK